MRRTENKYVVCFGITESKTTFKTAKYSYNYLEQLQDKISNAMINKKLTFITTSALQDDTNNIKVTVTSNNENDWNKVKELDTIGGAIEIEFSENNVSKENLLLEKK